MSQEQWDQIRIQAAIEVLGSLIDKTEIAVDVGGECVLKDIYAKAAVIYADALVAELQKEEKA